MTMAWNSCIGCCASTKDHWFIIINELLKAVKPKGSKNGQKDLHCMNRLSIATSTGFRNKIYEYAMYLMLCLHKVHGD